MFLYGRHFCVCENQKSSDYLWNIWEGGRTSTTLSQLNLGSCSSWPIRACGERWNWKTYILQTRSLKWSFWGWGELVPHQFVRSLSKVSTFACYSANLFATQINILLIQSWDSGLEHPRTYLLQLHNRLDFFWFYYSWQ